MAFGYAPHGQVGPAYRPLVLGRRGMVCSAHPLASQAGIRILQQGGNAIDAAVAVGLALGVVEPGSSGIGGDGFLMIYRAELQRVDVVNATGAAPSGATRDAYLPQGIPMKGIHSVSVPGIVDGWLAAHGRCGQLPIADVFAPAIELAEEGFPVSAVLASGLAADADLREFPSSRAIFTRDGEPLRPGDILTQRDLGATFRRVAEEGRSTFYTGAIARAIVSCSEQCGGYLTADDLANNSAVWQEPIVTNYRGYDVYESPPNSSGHVLLQELNLIEGFDLAHMGRDSAETIHLMVEAKKLAFADRERYLADPNFTDIPMRGLLSKEYAQERRRHINPARAATDVAPGNPWPFEGRAASMQGTARRSGPVQQDTTCLCVADRWGNAVTILQSIQGSFGSSLVVPDTGILLNNRMTYWHLDPAYVDCLEPGKRVRHTMNTVMAMKQNRLAIVCGTPGADTQVQTNLQMLTRIIDFGYDPVEVVEAPRWRHLQNGTESTVPHTCIDELRLESRFSQDVFRGLEQRGHPVTRIGDWEAAGNAMAITVLPESSALAGGADPRRDGYAIGW